MNNMQALIQQQVLVEVIKERTSQDTNFSQETKPLDPKLWISILGEEFGEVCKAALEGNFDDYETELIQVASVAIAALEDRRHYLLQELRKEVPIPTEFVEQP